MKDTKTNSEQIFNRPPRRTSFLGPMVGKLPTSGGGGGGPTTYTKSVVNNAAAHELTITNVVDGGQQPAYTINYGGGSGTSDYNDLSNKPQIGDITLQGNKTASDLGLATEAALTEEANARANGDLRVTNQCNFKINQEKNLREEGDRDLHDTYIVPLEENKQDKEDQNLETTSKTVVGAINELNRKTSRVYLHSCGIRNIVNGEYIAFEVFTNEKDAPTMSQLMLHKQLNWSWGAQAVYVDGSGNFNYCMVKSNNATKFIILMNNVPIEWNINECNYEFHDVINLLDVSEA